MRQTDSAQMYGRLLGRLPARFSDPRGAGRVAQTYDFALDPTAQDFFDEG